MYLPEEIFSKLSTEDNSKSTVTGFSMINCPSFTKHTGLITLAIKDTGGM